MKPKISIDRYIQKLEKFVNSDYGRLVRTQFADIRGDTELAMLVAPSTEELEEFKKAVDPANLAIFFNGYALHCKRVS